MNDRERIVHLRALNLGLGLKRPIFMSGYADASYKNDHPYKGGGWGIWVRDDKTRVLRSGVCPDWVRTSFQAEACAVWAAIYTALTHLDIKRCNILIVKTDCKGLTDYYRGQSIPKDNDIARGVRRAFEMAYELGIKLVVKWVKGHQRERVGPGYLNHRVDRLAWDARVNQESFKRVFAIENEEPR